MRYVLTSLIVAVCLLSGARAFSCNVCHSKNPKMRQMHAALEYKDCFKCHQMGFGMPLDERKKQRETDPLCLTCHRK